MICDWGFVIYMFVLIDALAIEEHKHSVGECNGDEMAFNEMVCDKIFTIQCALLCSINMWVFLEGGWNTFATNMNVILTITILLKIDNDNQHIHFEG